METAITFLELKKLVKQHGNKATLNKVQSAIDSDKIGMIYIYARGETKFIVKRYATGRFIKKSWH